MSRDPLNRQRTGIVFGAFIIVVGLFALLDNLHLFDAHRVQPFWPLIFVALGGVKLSQSRSGGHVLVCLAMIALGVGMTLQNLGLIHFEWRQLWPLALIFVGLRVISRSFMPRSHLDSLPMQPGQHDERMEHGARIQASATLSGIVLKNDSQEFTGGEINAAMGSVQVDLRQAAIATEAVLHLSVVMGGVEIKVPREWSISVNGSPMLGGIEDKTVPPMTPGKRLLIEGSVIMGGVEISN